MPRVPPESRGYEKTQIKRNRDKREKGQRPNVSNESHEPGEKNRPWTEILSEGRRRQEVVTMVILIGQASQLGDGVHTGP